MPLIRARSVVQVHPGPPFTSAVNPPLFSLFPFPGPSLQKPVSQNCINSTPLAWLASLLTLGLLHSNPSSQRTLYVASASDIEVRFDVSPNGSALA